MFDVCIEIPEPIWIHGRGDDSIVNDQVKGRIGGGEWVGSLENWLRESQPEDEWNPAPDDQKRNLFKTNTFPVG